MTNKLISKNRLIEIRSKANSTLENSEEQYTLSRLLNIASKHEIKVYESQLEEISGALMKENNQWVIYINRNDSKQRQIFTIAHELGHFFLHRDEKDEFIDSPFIYREETNRFAEMEIEANEFAGNLVMPEKEIRSLVDIENYDDNDVRRLANHFNVSLMALQVRLNNIKQ